MLRLKLGSPIILGNSMYVKGRARNTKQQGAMWYSVEMGLICVGMTEREGNM